MSKAPTIETTLSRLANYIECQLVEVVPQLIAKSRTHRATSILGSAADLLSQLRRTSSDEEVGDDE